MEQAEIDAVVKAFNELGVKPKADNAAALAEWMASYVASNGLEKKPPVEGQPPTPKVIPQSQEKMVTQRTIPPKVAPFSGEDGKDADYDLWRFEVNCLQTGGTFEDAVILHQVRKSLRGGASRVAMRLGDQASLSELLRKLDDLYGNIQLPEEILAEFYNAKQKEKESVVAWSCRLEDILIQAQQQGKVTAGLTEEMLRTKFWSGLRPILKEKSRHKVDSIKDFDLLRIELRKVEAELLKEPGLRSINKVQVTKEDTSKSTKAQTAEVDLKALQHQVVNLQQQLSDWKSRPPSSAPAPPVLNPAAKPYNPPPPQPAAYHGQPPPSAAYHGQPPPSAAYHGQPPPPLMQPPPPLMQLDPSQPSYYQAQPQQSYGQYGGRQQDGNSQGVECYRCHQLGHIARNCRVIGDHLNPRGPMYSSGRTWVHPGQPRR